MIEYLDLVKEMSDLINGPVKKKILNEAFGMDLNDKFNRGNKYKDENVTLKEVMDRFGDFSYIDFMMEKGYITLSQNALNYYYDERRKYEDSLVRRDERIYIDSADDGDLPF